MGDNRKLLRGREEICKEMKIGKCTFYAMKKAGAPIKKMDNRYVSEKNKLLDFIDDYLSSTSEI